MSGASDWELVESIVGRAEGLAPGEREALLDEACGDDAELRAEVESLLDRLETSAEFFDVLERRAGDLREEVESARAPERIGPYEVEEEIGRGGMGVVYRARDSRLGRPVALKLLPPWTTADPRARERMIDEAKAASALDHPNIGVLYDVVETDDGTLALVLAYYPGETLAERLSRGPVPVEEAIGIAEQVARGLDAAHEKGIVHRDVKPSNVLLGEDGRVRILDFGIAKVAGTGVTREGAPLGTAAYMSPEQASGEPVDHRTDLWALGVMLHEMVTGRRPFRGASEAAVLRAILDDEPPPAAPPEGSAPDGLAAAIDRLLSKDPADRYASAEDLGVDLRALAAGEVPGRAARTARWRRAGLAAGVVGALLAVGGWWYAARGPVGESPPEEIVAAAASTGRVAVLPFAVRGDPSMEYLSAGIPSLLAVVLDGTGGLRAVDPNAVLARAEGRGIRDPRVASAAAGDVGASRWVIGDVVAVEGRLRVRASLYDRARGLEPVAHVSVEGAVERLFNLVDEIAAQLLLVDRVGPAEDLVQVAGLTTGSIDALKRYLEGEAAFREGRFHDALESFGSATEADSLFALAWYRQSVAAGWIHRYDRQSEAAEVAWRLADRLPPLERRLLEAERAWPAGEVDRAEAIYREVLEDHPESPEAWFNYGELLMHANSVRGRSFVESKPVFERTLELYGRDHEEALIHLADLAAWESRHADYDSLFARLHPEGDLAVVYEAQKVFAMGTPEERARALERLEGLPPARIRQTAGRTGSLTRNFPGALRIARLLVDDRHAPAWRAMGELLVAIYETAMGRWAAAWRALDRAEETLPGPTLLLRGWLAGVPMSDLSADRIEAARESLQAWRPEEETPSGIAVLDADADVWPHLRIYLMGLLSARLGEVAAVRSHAGTLARLPEPPESEGLARDLGRELAARAAALEGRPADALAILDSTRTARSYRRTVRSPFYQNAHGRWLRAELLRETGDLEGALAWYRSLPQHYLEAVVFEAPAALRRAEILEGLGRSEEAASARARASRAWRNADPGVPGGSRPDTRRPRPVVPGTGSRS